MFREILAIFLLSVACASNLSASPKLTVQFTVEDETISQVSGTRTPHLSACSKIDHRNTFEQNHRSLCKNLKTTVDTFLEAQGELFFYGKCATEYSDRFWVVDGHPNKNAALFKLLHLCESTITHSFIEQRALKPLSNNQKSRNFSAKVSSKTRRAPGFPHLTVGSIPYTEALLAAYPEDVEATFRVNGLKIIWDDGTADGNRVFIEYQFDTSLFHTSTSDDCVSKKTSSDVKIDFEAVRVARKYKPSRSEFGSPTIADVIGCTASKSSTENGRILSAGRFYPRSNRTKKSQLVEASLQPKVDIYDKENFPALKEPTSVSMTTKIRSFGSPLTSVTSPQI
ncbi:MAG: hypothetical protein HON43_06345 [Alphaproteobacteria bacterium]|jgi:hypothetical protein|nr:hypothetical protein [Alphaproteobacteria bacterium]MBT5389112.1 hypothetical protein [Alphaproteobacteria bacterium]MBT5541047.1 hypothetical protein [Alphaproteobacteria bacterium]